MKQKWEVKKLGDVCDVINGYAFKSKYYVDDGIRVMRITNVQKGFLIDNDPKYYPLEKIDIVSRFMLQENDILISLTGNVGRVGIVTKKILPSALNQRVGCLRIKSPNINFRFLYYNLHSNNFESTCVSTANGIAQKNLSSEWLRNHGIPVPPMEVQEAIVKELDTLYLIKEKQEEQLAQYDNLAQSTFYSMFGDPIDNEKGWEVRKLGEVAKCHIGVTYKPENVSEDGEIVLRSGNIQNSEIDLSTDIVRINKNISDKYIVKVNDILMCSRNGSARLVGKCAKIKNVPPNTTFGAFMTIIRSEYFEYLYAFFNTDGFRSQLTSSGTTTVNQITLRMLREILLPIPPLFLQEKFAERIEHIEAQKELLKKSIADTQLLIDYTMDKYFG